PSINDDKITSDNSLENYQVNITALEPNTTYYVRAFAQNASGVSYGEELTSTTDTPEPVTRYVSENGTGDGSSWANASNDLQLMINNSFAGDSIFVASGTYKPIRPANNVNVIAVNNRDNAFVLKSGVKIYGGFAGTENYLS